MNHTDTLVIACATVMEAIRPHLPDHVDHVTLDFGLHALPCRLHRTLQEHINRADGRYDTLILGYGLCSLALAGISAAHSQLVIPRVDDCIAIFLGSRSAYLSQFNRVPGTYYLTKGWIEAGDTPFSEYDKNCDIYGKEKADAIYQLMMANYTRLVFIHTQQAANMDSYRNYTRETAKRFGLVFGEVQGSDALIQKLLHGPWDEDILIVEPGGKVRMEAFIAIN